MTGLTISAAFVSAAARVPDRVAIEFEGREVTYAQLERDSARLANALLAGGEPKGRVGVMIANRPEFVVTVLGIARAGMASVPIPVRSTARELTGFARTSELSALVVASSLVDGIGDALGELAGTGVPVHGTESSFEAAPSLPELIASGSDRAVDRAAEDDAFFFGFTSGTTGTPKAAVVSHRARTLLSLAYGQEYGCYTPDERHLISTPMYHGAGLTRGLAPLLAGASIELHERFDPERVLLSLASDQVTATFMVPTMFAAIFDLPETTLARGRTGVRTILSNASALPEHLKHRILEQWPGVRLFEIYGSTEAGTVTSLRPEDQIRKQRCVGLPLPLTELILIRPDGGEAEADEVGKLYSRSPYLFDGYYGNAAATDAAMHGGYLTSGDLARRDEEGYLYIVGRESDVIVSGGVNVYPREVEEYLTEHPAVREAAVFGAADERWGESVHAVLVADPHATLPSPDELLEHCRRGLGPAKIPKTFSFRPALPRTDTGKVAKHRLAAELEQAGTHEGERSIR
jgi:acyl-CoA synthetase (AMP-forming)/AMP-acid ligase II